MSKLFKKLALAASTIAAFILGLLFIFDPSSVSTTIVQVIGAVFTLEALTLGAKFYKEFKGKKVIEEVLEDA